MVKVYSIYIFIILNSQFITPAESREPVDENPDRSTQCSVEIPPPLFKSKPPELHSYHAVHSIHEIRESGEDTAGLVFSFYRAGCLEYGEVLVFKYPSEGKPIQPMAFWLKKIGNSLSQLGSLAKNDHISKRGSEFFELAKRWNPKIKPKLGGEEVDLSLEEEDSGKRVKVQASIGGRF